VGAAERATERAAEARVEDSKRQAGNDDPGVVALKSAAGPGERKAAARVRS
jgi:hypothetical protein